MLQELMWVLLPASVVGLVVGLGVFAGVYFAVTLAMKRWMKTYKVSDPQDVSEIVRERYARGEISREEYERLQKDLGAGR